MAADYLAKTVEHAIIAHLLAKQMCDKYARLIGKNYNYEKEFVEWLDIYSRYPVGHMSVRDLVSAYGRVWAIS